VQEIIEMRSQSAQPISIERIHLGLSSKTLIVVYLYIYFIVIQRNDISNKNAAIEAALLLLATVSSAACCY